MAKRSNWVQEQKKRQAQFKARSARAARLADALRAFADDLRSGGTRYPLAQATEGQRALVEMAHFQMRRFAAGERSR